MAGAAYNPEEKGTVEYEFRLGDEPCSSTAPWSFHAAHDAPRMQDPAVLRERAKVRYVPDEALAALLPARVAVVEVALRDGARRSERVEAVRGAVRNPMMREEVVAKARDLMAPVLGGAKTSRAIEAVLALETLRDVRALTPLLQR